MKASGSEKFKSCLKSCPGVNLPETCFCHFIPIEWFIGSDFNVWIYWNVSGAQNIVTYLVLFLSDSIPFSFYTFTRFCQARYSFTTFIIDMIQEIFIQIWRFYAKSLQTSVAFFFSTVWQMMKFSMLKCWFSSSMLVKWRKSFSMLENDLLKQNLLALKFNVKKYFHSLPWSKYIKILMYLSVRYF